MEQQAKLLGEDGGQKDYQQRTSGGYDFYEVVSAWTKEVRRGNEDAAVYWTLELTEGGYPKYFWSRVGVFVAEDIGLANPLSAPIINAYAQMYERRLKNKSKWSDGPLTCELAIAATLYLCRSAKSGEVGYAAYAVWNERRDRGRHDEIPEYALDMHTQRGKEIMRQSGMTKNDEESWWYRVLSFRNPIKAGNKWIRRWLMADDLLTDSELREELIQREYEMYGESEEGQLPYLGEESKTEEQGDEF